MPANVVAKIAFLNGEIAGLRSRINGQGNAVQHSKMEMLTDIRDDYAKSLERAQQAERDAE